jgi:hypothetical protein
LFGFFATTDGYDNYDEDINYGFKNGVWCVGDELFV